MITEQEAAMEQYLSDYLTEISEDNIRYYLGTYGDAVEKRIRECVTQAQELHALNFLAPRLQFV